MESVIKHRLPVWPSTSSPHTAPHILFGSVHAEPARNMKVYYFFELGHNHHTKLLLQLWAWLTSHQTITFGVSLMGLNSQNCLQKKTLNTKKNIVFSWYFPLLMEKPRNLFFFFIKKTQKPRTWYVLKTNCIFFLTNKLYQLDIAA